MSDLLPGRVLWGSESRQPRWAAVHALRAAERSERAGPDAALPQRARLQKYSFHMTLDSWHFVGFSVAVENYNMHMCIQQHGINLHAVEIKLPSVWGSLPLSR